MRKIDYTTYVKPTDYISLPTGTTKIRILSLGIMVLKHGMQIYGGGYKPLGNCTEDGKCEYCNKGNEPKLRYQWIASNGNRIGLLSVGPEAGNQICMIAKKEGDPTGYELFIIKTGTGKQSKYLVKKGKVIPLDPEYIKTIEGERAFLIRKYFIGKQEVK